MKLIEALVRWLIRRDALVDWIITRAKRRPYYDIEMAGSLYMRRWWLFGGVTPSKHRWAAVRLHEIIRSDADRHLHDHPAWNLSVVLRGGYFEAVPFETYPQWCRDRSGAPHSEHVILKWRGPGSVVFRRATDRHRLILNRGKPSWTLFVIGRKSNAWGFYTPDGKVPWRDYTHTPKAAA